MRLKSIFSLCLLSFTLAACGTAAKLDSATKNFAAGNYDKIAATPDSNNLDILIGAHGAFAANDFAASDDLFENFNKRNIDPTSTGIMTEAGKLVGGQMATSYKPYMMDYMFVSYYQIWDALLSGRYADARVIINQSYDRQQKMSREYKKLISNRQKSELADSLKADTSYWKPYSDIMNPALTYLAGLYYLNNGEHENARQYLARTSGMIPNNSYVKTDLDLAANGKTPNNIAWIFIETGFAPRLTEEKMSFLWPIDGDLQAISIAIAKPKSYVDNSIKPTGAQLVTDVDSMFMTEFKEYQINDALRAAAKAISNSLIQSTAQDKDKGWGTVLSAAYTVATTNAEIRSWVTLPQHIYVLRVKKDKSGLINLNSGATLELEFEGNHLVYIRGNDIKTVKIK